MATLFLARRSGAAGFSRHVAIKVVHPHLAEDPSFIRMFVDEALLTARIHHPNVVHIEELGEEQGTYFLVMEYVHGSALSTLLGTLARGDRRLAPELAVHIAMKVADGLDAAHELRDEHGRPLNVVHRDVSPQNVLLSSSGHVKLIDFGIAKAAGQGRRTETGSLKGKVRYMSPEQAFGKTIDRRTDVYALAIVLWEMLTMQRLFKGASDLALLDEVRNPVIRPPSMLSPELPSALDRVVLTALARDVDARPRTAREFRQMLQDAFPAAAAVGEERLGEVVRAVLGDHIAERRLQLPESVTGLNVKGIDQRSDMARNEVLRTMTLSAPGARLEVDHEISEPRGAPPPAQLPQGAMPPWAGAGTPPPGYPAYPGSYPGYPPGAPGAPGYPPTGYSHSGLSHSGLSQPGYGSGALGSAPGTPPRDRALVAGALGVAVASLAVAGTAIYFVTRPAPTVSTTSLATPVPAASTPTSTPSAPVGSPAVGVPSTPPATTLEQADAGAPATVEVGVEVGDEGATDERDGRGGRRRPSGRRTGTPASDEAPPAGGEDDGVRRIRTGGVTIYDDEY